MKVREDDARENLNTLINKLNALSAEIDQLSSHASLIEQKTDELYYLATDIRRMLGIDDEEDEQ